MDNDIHQVVAKGVESPKVVVEGKAHHPYPTVYLPGGEQIKELRKSGDMEHRFILNNFIIKDKLAMEAGEVDNGGAHRKKEKNEEEGFPGERTAILCWRGKFLFSMVNNK